MLQIEVEVRNFDELNEALAVKADVIMPVSYTHLVIAMALAAINYKYLAKLWFIYVPLAMGPVSYTHLDVYKRQVR